MNLWTLRSPQHEQLLSQIRALHSTAAQSLLTFCTHGWESGLTVSERQRAIQNILERPLREFLVFRRHTVLLCDKIQFF